MKNVYIALMLAGAVFPASAWAAPAVTGVARNLQWPGTADAVTISANVTGDTISSVQVYVNSGSGFAPVAMVVSSGDTYTAQITPGGTFADVTLIKYYVQATDAAGTTVFPTGAPSSFNTFFIDNNPVGNPDPGVLADLVINEILYDPPGGDNGNYTEFVEVYNRRSTPIDMSYFRLRGKNETAAETYAFPEGTIIQGNEYLVLAGKLSAFNTNYGSLKVGGVFPFPVYDWGKTASWMPNSGTNGQVALFHPNAAGYATNPLGNPFDGVTYLTSGDWPGGTESDVARNPNNGGPSVELINPAYNKNLGTNWKSSTFIMSGQTLSRGTPGLQNSTYETFSLRVGGTTRDVQYPTSASIITMSATVTGPSPITSVKVVADIGNGSGFQPVGTLSLTGPDTYTGTIGPFANHTYVKYYVEAMDSASATATNPEDAPAGFGVFLVDDAPAGANQLVINEIMYNPTGTDNVTSSEWVEVTNVSNEPVDVSYFQFSPRTTAYSTVAMPEGTIIPANGFLVLAGDKDLFLANYPDGSLPDNIDPSRVVDLNWIAGTVLTEAGDAPSLRHINQAGYTGAAYTPFDIVAYTNAAPWPINAELATGGPSIELQNPTLANQTGANWKMSDLSIAPKGTPQAVNSSLSSVGDWSIY